MMRRTAAIISCICLVFLSAAGCSQKGADAVISGQSGSSLAETPDGKEGDASKTGNVDVVHIATLAVGSSYYAMGTGVAKIITEYTPINGTVLPYSGPDAWMPEVKDGIVGMGILSAIDLSWAYSGTVNYEEAYYELRMLLSGNWSNHCTMTVLESSGITSIKELAGKKVGYEYGGNKLTTKLVDAALASVGMTIDDCVAVPLADLASAQRALQERRVDAIFTGTSTTPASVQLDEAIGIRVLPYGDLKPEDIAEGVPEEMQKILDQYVPGATAQVCPAGGTVKEETVLITYPIQLAVSDRLSEDDVYIMTKAIYEHHQELADVNIWGKEWVPENYVLDSFTVPYHEGAVKYYKEAGLWTENADKCQEELCK